MDLKQPDLEKKTVYAVHSIHGLLMDRTDDLEKAKRFCDTWFNAAYVIADGKQIVYRKYAA